MSNDLSADDGKKKRNRKRRSIEDLNLPAEVQEIFTAAVKEAAGKPLSMAPGSPLGRVIGAFVEHSLKQELNEHLGYDAHQRIVPEPEAPQRRSNTRNGYSQKQLKTSMGSTEIDVPRDREGSFSPQLLAKHQSMSAEIEGRVISMYAHGMTTRDIAEHIRELYHFEATDGFVSRLLERVEPELIAWRSRPLEEVYAIAYIDAIHLKIRHPNGVTSTAAYIVGGYGESGHHEILGVWIAPSDHSTGHGESAAFWHTVLVELNKRGLKRILIACSDNLNGLSEALSVVFAATEHLPCVVHQMRSSLSYVSWTHRKTVARQLKTIYQAPTYESAEMALAAFKQEYQSRYPEITRQWEAFLPRIASLWSYSDTLRRMVYTTNPQENVNRQVRKVTKNRSQMPNIDSALRLLTLALRDIHNRAISSERARPDWTKIVRELHIHFPTALPDQWGLRS
jgi:putative transposase